MEPITLCGLVVVAFGLWIELEAMVKALLKTTGNCKMLTGVMSLFSDQMAGDTNRYVHHTR